MDNVGLTQGIIMLMVMGIVGLVCLTFTGNHRDRMQFQFKLFMAAFLLRFFFSVAIYVTGLVNILGDEDGSGWSNGLNVAQHWTEQNLGIFDLLGAWKSAFDGAHRGYSYMLGTVFFITDAGYRMVAAVLNNFIGAMTVVLVYRITRTIFSEWAAERAAWWCCFMPSLVIWSAQTVKEPTVIFLETLAMYACLHLKSKSFRLRHFWLLSFSLVFLVTFRFYAAYLAIVAILVSLALPNLKKFNFSTVTAGFVGVLVLALLYGSGALIQNEAMFEKFNLKQAKEFRVNVAEGAGSGVKIDADIETPLGFVYGVGMGGVYLLLAPFPWQWGGGSTRLLLTLPELLVWWFLFFKCVLPGMKKSIQERFTDVLPVLIFFSGLFMLYSVMFGNVGLAYRQRAQLLPWLLIFAAVGMEIRQKEQFMRRMAPTSAGVVRRPSIT